MSFLRMEIRGGTRGGKDQFDWEDVKADKHRENYLGHSVRAPVGRWQKGKDLTWYTKESKVVGRKDKLREEIAVVKKAEEEAMAAALGLKPSGPSQPHSSLTKQEIADVCRRRSEGGDDAGEDVMKGVGYQSRRSQMLYMYSGTEGTTSREGMTVFEHDPAARKEDGRLRMAAPPPKKAKREDEPAPKSKHKKKSKKSEKHRHHSSDSEEGERKRKRKSAHKHKRRRHDSDSD